MNRSIFNIVIQFTPVSHPVPYIFIVEPSAILEKLAFHPRVDDFTGILSPAMFVLSSSDLIAMSPSFVHDGYRDPSVNLRGRSARRRAPVACDS